VSDVYVVGVSMTQFGRFLEKSVRDLTEAAVDAALVDAGCKADRIEAVFFANAAQGAMDGQHSIRGELSLRSYAFDQVPIVNIENACASGSTAFHMAYAHVKAGLAEVAMAVGAEKMYDADKNKSFRIFDGSWDVHNVEGTVSNLLAMGDGVETPAECRETGPHSVFMDVYQAFAKFHMREFGTTPRQMAAVAAKNHHHSVHNSRAQFRRDYTIDDVLGARMISWPLTLPMCSPISDGASAVLLCSKSALGKFDKARTLEVRASLLASGGHRVAEDYRAEVSHVAARRTYEAAGIAPKDLSLAEVHDATAIGEIQQTENLMLCDFGDGGPLAERGDTRIGGRIPVNPSGGLESKGHPIGATGLAQIFELATQLRGEAGPRQVADARLAIAENGGGLIGVESAAVCITILGR
jgi:acetyl-CoA acyltransferase